MPRDRGPVFEITWRETGGPAVSRHEKQGFGSSVTVEVIEFALDARVELTFQAAGVVWQATLSLEPITDMPHTSQAA